MIGVQNKMGVEFCPVWSITIKIYRRYWISITRQDSFYFIFSWKQRTNENIKKILSHSWNNEFHIQHLKHTVFWLLHFLCFKCNVCLFQILDNACNTWCDVTIVYFHTVNFCEFCHFHNVKITACEDMTFIQWIKPSISLLKM